MFNDRITLIEGDSNTAIPVAGQIFKTKYDLFHIDGGHTMTIANTDFQNCKKLAHKNSYVIFDDTQIPELGYLWRQYIQNNEVQEVDGLLQTQVYTHAVGLYKIN
jgi:glyoxylate utilization-related uncharacterized protein